MKQHPTELTWMEFLYDELPTDRKSEVERHIAGCAECRAKLGELQATQAKLNQWRVVVPAKFRVAKKWAPGLKWAAAAALLVTTAFAAGRFSKPELDLAAIQASLSAPIQESVEKQVKAQVAAVQADVEKVRDEANKSQIEMAAEMKRLSEKALAEALAANKHQMEQLARTVAALRDEDRKIVYASLQEMQAQLTLENRKLREGIETVALLTDRSLKDAQRKLVQLASYTVPPETE
jgi:anti-sigma factor RsiW